MQVSENRDARRLSWTTTVEVVDEVEFRAQSYIWTYSRFSTRF